MTKKALGVIIVVVGILLALAASAETMHYYKIELQYSFGNVTPTTVTVQPSPTPLFTPVGQYLAEVVSSDNQILNVTFFDIPTLVLFDTVDPETGEINGGGQFELNETNVTLYVPYFEDAVEINFYNWSLNRIGTVDVSEYSPAAEGDVVAGDEAAGTEGEEGPGAQEPTEQEPSAKRNMGLLAIIGVLLAVLVVVIIRVALKNRRSDG